MWGDLSFVLIVLGTDLWWGSGYLGFTLGVMLTYFIARRVWYHYRPYETPPPRR